MSQDVLREAIKKLQEDLEKLTLEANKKKQAINVLHETLGEKGPYEIEGESKAQDIIRRSQFYGKTFPVAAQEFLQMRKDACTAEEIYQGLEEGAFDFPWETNDRLRNVAISLSRNPEIFRKLPNNTFGLSAWYQNGQPRRRRLRPPGLEVEIESKDAGESQDQLSGSTEEGKK